MANTIELKEKVESWYRNYLKELYPGYTITKEKVLLQWGGHFEYDAVVKIKDKILEVRCLSCSEYKTKSGNGGSGKLLKIKADAMMMLGTECDRKVLSFTGRTMYKKIIDEQINGRFPTEIIIEYIDPDKSKEISEVIARIYEDASSEMNPEI